MTAIMYIKHSTDINDSMRELPSTQDKVFGGSAKMSEVPDA